MCARFTVSHHHWHGGSSGPRSFPQDRAATLRASSRRSASRSRISRATRSSASHRSSQAELVVVEVDHLTHRPSHVSWEQAGLCLLREPRLMRRCKHRRRLGAAGGVGSIAVQLAWNIGAKVIRLAAAVMWSWLELGVAPDRIDTIINFAAAAKHGVKTAGNSAAANTKVLAELASLINAGWPQDPDRDLSSGRCARGLSGSRPAPYPRQNRARALRNGFKGTSSQRAVQRPSPPAAGSCWARNRLYRAFHPAILGHRGRWPAT
jgi:hypothetical protein